MTRDPFWRRSSFGSLLFMLGTMAIFWLVEGSKPDAQDWIEVLVLALTVLGYQGFRPRESSQ